MLTILEILKINPFPVSFQKRLLPQKHSCWSSKILTAQEKPKPKDLGIW
jgi:hypothetical protein